MEDVLVKVLCLCSVETLAWIQCAKKHLALRYILHKNLKVICNYHSCKVTLKSLFFNLNLQQLCTKQVSDSYRNRHWKQHFTISKFVKQCALNGIDTGLNLTADFNLNCLAQGLLRRSTGSEPYRIAFSYLLAHHLPIDGFPLSEVDPEDIVYAAVAYSKFELLDLVDAPLEIRYSAICYDNRELFMEPSKYIPTKYINKFSSKELTAFTDLPETQQEGWIYTIVNENISLLCKIGLDVKKYILFIEAYSISTIKYLHSIGELDNHADNLLTKELFLGYWQICNREEVDIDKVLTTLMKRPHSWLCKFVYILREWYSVPKEKLQPLVAKLLENSYDNIYKAYLKEEWQAFLTK